MNTTGSGSGAAWLGAALAPILAVVVLVAAVAGHRDPADPHCLPDMPQAPTTGRVVMPVTAGTTSVSSPYGPRDGGFHAGQDTAGPVGTPIYAATDGTVVAAGPATGFGNWIIVDTDLDGQKLSTVYGHMFDDGVLVHIGDTVSAGQRIASIGNNGESTGPHLHFEVWPGGRLSGGKPIDPAAWLDVHRATEPDPSNVALAASSSAAGSGGGGRSEMAALPNSKGTEEHWQVDTIRVTRAVAARFPQITTIGGWRPHDAIPDHPSGRAADIMIPGWDTPEGKALGDRIADYVLAHADVFHVDYLMWRQRYRPASGTATTMQDRGSPTANHFDHLHITTEGHGYPAPGQTYGPLPVGGANVPRSGCDATPPPGSGAGSLKPGSVPAPFEPWILRAAATCPEASAPLLAAQLENEGGFRVDAHNNGSGADGPAQFIPSTWAAKAVDGDGDGTRNTRSIPDAVMTQAAYDCELAGIARQGLADGALDGDLVPLMLSMYNCGPAATLAQGGVCRNPETLAYVRNIPAQAQSAFTAPTAVTI